MAEMRGSLWFNEPTVRASTEEKLLLHSCDFDVVCNARSQGGKKQDFCLNTQFSHDGSGKDSHVVGAIRLDDLNPKLSVLNHC